MQKCVSFCNGSNFVAILEKISSRNLRLSFWPGDTSYVVRNDLAGTIEFLLNQEKTQTYNKTYFI